MSKETEPKSLAARMALVMGDVPTMLKDGQNTQQKYGYTTAEAVKSAIRPLLKKHGIGLFASMKEVSRETSINRNNTTVVTVIAKMSFVLVNADNPEDKHESEWVGEAIDYADKAVNKAATAATKYWLTNTFLLSTSEPEADEETIEAGNNDPEFLRAVEAINKLHAQANKVDVKLTTYSAVNKDEAKRAYTANVKELIKYAKSLKSETPQPEGFDVEEWIFYIASAQEAKNAQ